MELQFNKTAYECLRPVVSQVQNGEQTQEVRLTDSMPDIGRVLLSWGQVLLRSKEWRRGGMTVSGGVMVWVLYAPEDGSEEQVVEAWLPFQLKWEFPETQYDGFMQAACQLRMVDARSVSTRKLMVRASISCMGQALEPGQFAVYEPMELPGDVQLLRRSYPISYPREAGERLFSLDEEFTLPASAGKVQKLIRYELQPEMIDQKVMGDKVVFRGIGLVHVLYRAEDGELRNWNSEVNFSQFSDLEREYAEDTWVQVIPAVTGLELDVMEDGRLRLKAGMVGQYVVFDRQMVEIVEDAYSTQRTVKPELQELEVPMILDHRRETVRMDEDTDAEGEQIVDVAFLVGQPRQRRDGNKLELELSGAFQLLTRDGTGRLQGQTVNSDEDISIPADENSTLSASAWPTGRATATANGNEAALQADVLVDSVTTTNEGIPMVVGLQLGETTLPDPNRPSLILRRAGKRTLWELAKMSGSTMDAIRMANHLSGEPEEEQMLLIPVP